MKKRIHFSWIVCALCTLMIFCTTGMSSSAFSVYSPYIISVNGFTGTQSSTIVTLRSVAGVAILFFVNPIIRKLGAKKTVIVGLLCNICGYLSYAFAHSFIMYCLGACLTGIANQIAGMVPAAIILNEWFKSQKNTAVSICAAGTGLASVFMAPIVTKLAENVSLKAAFLIEAYVMMAVTVLVFLLLRNKPSELNIEPFTSNKSQKTGINSFYVGNMDKKTETLLIIAFAFLGIGNSIPSFNHSVLYRSCGHSAEFVGTMLSIYGAVLMFTKFLFGAVTDKIGGRKSQLIFPALFILAVSLDCFAASGNKFLAECSFVLTAFGIPVSTISMSVVPRELASPERFAELSKNYQLMFTAGMIFGSLIPGIIYDACGSYVPAFAVSLCSLAMFTLITQLAYAIVKKQNKQNMI